MTLETSLRYAGAQYLGTTTSAQLNKYLFLFAIAASSPVDICFKRCYIHPQVQYSSRLMSQKNSKTKMVSFRLSPAEYEAALAACRAHGFRSMSMLARSAFLSFSPGQRSQGSPYDEELSEIRRRLEF